MACEKAGTHPIEDRVSAAYITHDKSFELCEVSTHARNYVHMVSACMHAAQTVCVA